MNSIIIIISILILLLLLNKSLDNYYFSAVLMILLFIYLFSYNKENYILGNDQSILKLHDKIKFFENANMTIDEYEQKHDVKINLKSIDFIQTKNEEVENTMPIENVKYGDIVLIQCNAMENRYLSGNRDGHNPVDTTGDNFEGVYTLDDDESILKWKILSKDTSKMNSEVLIGDDIIFLCLSPNSEKYLIGEQPFVALPYNISDTLCGVYTRSKETINDNFSNHYWKILDEKELINSKRRALRYNELCYIKHKTKYLSGARQYGYIQNESNQQVYTVDKFDGKLELLWSIQQHKCKRPQLKNINIWDNQPDLLQDEVGENNIFISSNYQLLTATDSRQKNDSDTFGKRIPNSDGSSPLKIENDIILFKNDECSNNLFMLINFNKEFLVKKGVVINVIKLLNKISFFVKIAGSDGIFTDLGGLHEYEYPYKWIKNNLTIKIKYGQDFYNVYNEPKLNINDILQNLFILGDGYSSTSDFILKVENDLLYILKKVNNNYYIVIPKNTGTILEPYKKDSVPDYAYLKIIEETEEGLKFANNKNEYLFDEKYIKINDENYKSWVNFDINKKIQYVKFYNLKNCNLKLKFLDIDNKIIKFTKELSNIDSNYVALTKSNLTLNNTIFNEVYKNTNTGENTYIEIDNQEEIFIRGGILINQSANDSYVTKFKVLISDNYKIYEELDEYNFNIYQGANIEFKIFQKCRYVKVIILECSEKECKFKLSLF